MFGIDAAEMVGTKEHWKAFYPRKRPLLADLIRDPEIKRQMALIRRADSQHQHICAARSWLLT